MAALLALLPIGGRAIGGTQGMPTFGAIGLALTSHVLVLGQAGAAGPPARRSAPAEAPSLYVIVERLTRRAGLPMPRLYIIPSAAPTPSPPGATRGTRRSP